MPVPGKIPTGREEPSSAPYPLRTGEAAERFCPGLGRCAAAGKAQDRAGLGLGQELLQEGDQAEPGHSLSTDPLCIFGQQPCFKPDWSNTAGASF